MKKFPQERVEQATGKINFNDDIKNQAFEVVRGPFDTTVQGVLKFGDKLDKVAYTHGAKLDKAKTRKEKIDAATEMAEALGNPGVQSKVESILVKEGGASWSQATDEGVSQGNLASRSEESHCKDAFGLSTQSRRLHLEEPKG